MFSILPELLKICNFEDKMLPTLLLTLTLTLFNKQASCESVWVAFKSPGSLVIGQRELGWTEEKNVVLYLKPKKINCSFGMPVFFTGLLAVILGRWTLFGAGKGSTWTPYDTQLISHECCLLDHVRPQIWRAYLLQKMFWFRFHKSE